MPSKLQRQENQKQKMKSLPNLGNKFNITFYSHRSKDFQVLLSPIKMMRANRFYVKKKIQKQKISGTFLHFAHWLIYAIIQISSLDLPLWWFTEKALFILSHTILTDTKNSDNESLSLTVKRPGCKRGILSGV